MEKQHTTEIDQLRAEVAALRAQVERPRRPTTRRIMPLILAILLVALVPLSTLAANPFTDLNTGSPHNGNIDAIFNTGITTGCAPTEYCPSRNVTREEMASFLARTAGLGSNPPIANAATAINATNASTVGGLAPNGLVRVAQGKGPGVSSPVALDLGFKTIASVKIQAPGAGMILVSSVASIETKPGCPCRVDLRLRHVENDEEAPTLFANMGPSAGAVYQLSASPVWVFTVSRGGTKTFLLEGQRASGNGAPTVINSAVIALFIPFGPDGNPPAPQP